MTASSLAASFLALTSGFLTLRLWLANRAVTLLDATVRQLVEKVNGHTVMLTSLEATREIDTGLFENMNDTVDALETRSDDHNRSIGLIHEALETNEARIAKFAKDFLENDADGDQIPESAPGKVN